MTLIGVIVLWLPRFWDNSRWRHDNHQEHTEEKNGYEMLITPERIHALVHSIPRNTLLVV